MQRIQFYPSDALALVLNTKATNSGVSVSQYLTDVLEEYYGISNKQTQSITQLTAAVMDEVADYVRNNPPSSTFDLYSASQTYRKIPMTNGKKPKTVRASIGRSFVAQLGKGAFTNVVKYFQNGKQVLSSNNALMYEIK